jgi:hypothetical protein
MKTPSDPLVPWKSNERFEPSTCFCNLRQLIAFSYLISMFSHLSSTSRHINVNQMNTWKTRRTNLQRPSKYLNSFNTQNATFVKTSKGNLKSTLCVPSAPTRCAFSKDSNRFDIFPTIKHIWSHKPTSLENIGNHMKERRSPK